MNTKMSTLFYGKASKTVAKDTVPLYFRITIGGKRFEVSTNQSIQNARWIAGAEKVKGSSEQALRVNAELDLFKRKAHDIRREMLLKEEPFTIEVFKARWMGTSNSHHTLLSVMRDHNDKLEKLIGKGYEKTTVGKYQTTFKHVSEFIRWKYAQPDIDLRSLDYAFVTHFEFFLRSEKNLSVNSYGKVIKNLKKIVHECVAYDWLDKDPFVLYKVKHIDPQVPHLSVDELQRIENKWFGIERLDLVKDLFLFCCYTGLAYVDVASITRDHLIVGFDGKPWLIKNRQKTNVTSRIPLLPPALSILEKYKDDARLSNTLHLLPVISNQKVNAYLKEIADVCGIRKDVTFHVARHTFATTVTLGNGIPIETVSKMLGHKKLKTTQIYAEVVDMKLSQDMRKLAVKYDNSHVAEINLPK